MNIQSSNFGTQTRLKCGYYTGQYELASHVHQLSEIIVVTEGELVITVNGISAVARQGDIAFIPPFAPHSFSTPEYCKIWICLFSNDLVSDITSVHELYPARTHYVITPAPEVYAYAAPRLIDNNQEFVVPNDEIIRRAKTLIHTVYTEFCEHSEIDRGGKCVSSALISILLYINDHSKEDVTREDIAQALGYHPGYVSRCCNMIHGMNLRRLLNSARVDRAKELLVNTDFKIIDVALECGFACERSMHRAFVDVAGCSPGEYRRRKGKK